MIYKINIKTKENKDKGGKNFYLTADSHSQLYRRVRMQYGVDPTNVEILEEISEDSIDVNTVKNSAIGKKTVNQDVLEKLEKQKKKAARVKKKVQKEEVVEEKIDTTEADKLIADAYKITDAQKERLVNSYQVIDLDQKADMPKQIAEKLKLPHKKVKLYLTKNKESNKYEYILLFK